MIRKFLCLICLLLFLGCTSRKMDAFLFKKGDIVQLKCGSPSMVVERCFSGTCTCVWINYEGEKESGYFYARTLKKVEEENLP